MTNPPEFSRLDRIEAAIVADHQQSQERFDRIQQQFEEQMRLNAEFRTRHELVMREIAELKEANQIALDRDLAQSQNIQLLADQTQSIAESVRLLIGGLRQHASDGHGA